MNGSSGVQGEVAAKLTNISRNQQAGQVQSLLEGAEQAGDAAKDAASSSKSVQDSVNISTEAKELAGLMGGG